MTDLIEPAPLPYATPLPSARPLWSAAVLACLSLGLILLAGCFLIGIGLSVGLISVSPSPPHKAWTAGQYLFVATLYLCAGVSFVAGGWTGVLAVRKLA